MGNVYLSKSKYCKAKQCDKSLWLSKYKKEVATEIDNQSILDNGTTVGELARGIFGEYVNIEYQKELSKMLNQTKELLENGTKVITEASFDFNNNFCSVDILKNNEDGLEIYEVKSSTEIKDIYLDDISYQVYVLKGLGYNVNKASIVYINNQYVRQGKLELDKLFNIEDVTEIAFEKQEEVEEKIKLINGYMKQDEELNIDIDTYCFNPYKCEYWEYCTRNLPKNNVFKIRDMRKIQMIELYKNGIYSFEDVLKQDINEKFKQQIEYQIQEKGTYIDLEGIKECIDKYYFPLYFLDFETYQQPIPKYDGIRPYMQIPFQYSLHYIEKENGELKHKEFLSEAGIDPRRTLAERLVKDIPTNVCLLAYNMKFERMVIKELSEQFEDLKEDLLKIHDNIQDLMIPFKERMYYCRELEGSYSIKYVLPAMFPNNEELNYHNLPVVHNGSEAMSIFSELENYSKEEQEKIRYGLLKYCELDTLAMVRIWEKLKEITNGTI